MKQIPKYIDNAITMRMKSAERLNHYDCVVSNYCEKIGALTEHIRGNCTVLCEPSVAEMGTREAILKASEGLE